MKPELWPGTRGGHSKYLFAFPGTISTQGLGTVSGVRGYQTFSILKPVLEKEVHDIFLCNIIFFLIFLSAKMLKVRMNAFFFHPQEQMKFFDPKANAFDLQHNPRDQNCDFNDV